MFDFYVKPASNKSAWRHSGWSTRRHQQQKKSIKKQVIVYDQYFDEELENI